MADAFVVRVNRASTDRLLRKLEGMIRAEAVQPTRGIIVRRTAQILHEEMQQKMLTGGGGRWRPLSKWTVGRTGRTKAFASIAGLLQRRFRRGRAEILFRSPSDEWNLSLHHRGFRVRETKAFMRIPMLTGPVYLTRRKPFSVPARPIWPSDRRAVTVLNSTIRYFIKEADRTGP